jgi:hypothetical protein
MVYEVLVVVKIVDPPLSVTVMIDSGYEVAV